MWRLKVILMAVVTVPLIPLFGVMIWFCTARDHWRHQSNLRWVGRS